MTDPDRLARTQVPGGDPQVELVDAAGSRIGSASKDEAHGGAGRLHRAFSVFLLDARGNVLIQRRAATKYHSAGLWSNTCCGHPYPGEGPSQAAVRRIRDELGATVAADRLMPAGSLAYALTDKVSGVVEREFDHLFVGPAPRRLRPDAAEVAEVAYVPLGDLDMLIPDGFTMWFPLVYNAAWSSIEALASSGQKRPPRHVGP